MTIDGIVELDFDAVSGPSEAQRDLPLTFRWRTDPKSIDALGLAPARTSRHEDARNAVLTEAKFAYERNCWVSFSRRPAWYVGRRRYCGASYGYDPVLSAVADGVEAGLLEEERASPRTRGRQSRFRAAPLLHALISGAPVRSHLHEVIWLRDDRRRLVNYADTALTRRMRKEIEAVNTIMAEIEVDLAGPDVQRSGPTGSRPAPLYSRPHRASDAYSTAARFTKVAACTAGGKAFHPQTADTSCLTANQCSNQTTRKFTLRSFTLSRVFP